LGVGADFGADLVVADPAADPVPEEPGAFP
jgi:hypothetical protein